jgi:hypothetical protein
MKPMPRHTGVLKIVDFNAAKAFATLYHVIAYGVATCVYVDEYNAHFDILRIDRPC